VSIARQLTLGLILFTDLTAVAHAQVVWVRPSCRYGCYSPATGISAQIHAEANYLRAYGEAAADLNQARILRAQAVNLEIKNSVDYVKAYWERRSIGEAEKLKRHKTLAQKEDIRNSHLWQRLKDHPELSIEAIPNGTALNFLLDRLAGGVLAYQFSAGQNGPSMELLAQLELSPQTLHQLRVRQDLPSGERTVFRVDEGKPLDVAWWPAGLRGGELHTERTRFEAARSNLMVAPETSIDNNLKELFTAYDQLTEAFHRHHTRAVRLKSIHTHREYGLAKRFLQSLAGEMYRIRSVGPKALRDDGLKFEGKNVVALLTHMSRNGLEFAPSLPGEEAAYHQVFHMLRDLYVTVAEDDQAKAAKK
jgi:hypothetical protein